MQKASGTTRWWDWTSILLLFIIVETSASRLVATNWTTFLFLGQTVAYIGFTVGMALGYTRFSTRLSHWLSFLYMVIFLPLQWTLIIDQNTSLEEQFLSVGGRLLVSYSDFFARRPVEDPLFFITLITFGFWIIGASAAFQLVRKQNYLAAVIPSAIVLIFIHSYDSFLEGRVWIIAFFALLALLLLGRLHHLANKQSWRERRIFLSPDNNIDLIVFSDPGLKNICNEGRGKNKIKRAQQHSTLSESKKTKQNKRCGTNKGKRTDKRSIE